MIKNHWLIALRNIRRHKFYSLVTISCLAIGIAVSMTILLYVLHEHSYDRFHANAKRIFAVSASLNMGGASFNSPHTSYVTGPVARQENANVEGYLRTYSPYKAPSVKNPVVSSDPPLVGGGMFLFADSNFFTFFSFRLLRGQPASVLQRPNTVVLTARTAKKYFGDGDPIGRRLLYEDLYLLEVTGVTADPPSNSTINYDFVASSSTLAGIRGGTDLMKNDRVSPGNWSTWLLLKDPAGAPRVEKDLQRMAMLPGEKAAHPMAALPGEKMNEDRYPLTAMTDIHLGLNFGETTNTRYLKIFPLVAALILLLALVNYMSLATARAASRAREVGVRKTLGAGRGRIAGQFYMESAVYALLSFGAGLILFALIKPWFCNLLQLGIDSAFLTSPRVLAATAGLLVLVVAGAGSYPALVLSSFNPVAVLYGRIVSPRGGARVRQGFTVFQFAISAGLVLCSVIIGRQLDYIRHTDTGVDRDNVVMVKFNTTLKDYAAFKTAVETLPGVRGTATCRYSLYKGYDAMLLEPTGQRKGFALDFLNVDEHFISLLGLRWKDQPVRSADLSEGGAMVLNETAAAALGLSGKAVGSNVAFDKSSPGRRMAGILRDFNYQSLQDKIGPLCLLIAKDTAWGGSFTGSLFAKVGAHTNLPATIAAIRGVYEGYDKKTPFNYEFMDDAFNSLYKAEDRLAALFNAFTGVTILIACLGLFALATFSAQQRTKEIGIRKVLGASVAGIAGLLSRDFLKPVGIAVLVAMPVGGWAMYKWLESFAYRVTLSGWLFLLTGVGVMVVALLTVLLRSLRAARMNPVDNLRNE